MIWRSFIAIYIFISSATAWAGGPLGIWNDRPIVWPADEFPILYHLDPGPLGPLPVEDAQALIIEAFQQWQGVEGAHISLERGDDLPVDVDGLNYADYIDGAVEGLNPIIFDHDGAIISALFGQNASRDILGFASLTRTREDAIVSAQAMLNGFYLTQNDFTAETFRPTVLHELGHWLGLDHTQLLRHIAYDGVGANDVWTPIMFPTTTDDERSRSGLSDDDRWSLSMLYPDNGFESASVSIKGMVIHEGEPKPGVNVIARRVDRVTEAVYSTVSGAFDSFGGAFEFNRLPAGTYKVYIEPIDPLYRGSLSVGRYATSINSPSFLFPPPARFYHPTAGASRSAWARIDAAAGERIDDIIFDIDGDIAMFDENETQILALPGSQYGAVAGNALSRFQFILSLRGDEPAVEISIDGNENADFDLLVEMERRTSEFDAADAASADGTARFTLSPDSEPPLRDARYFIAVRNRSIEPVEFIITADIPTASADEAWSLYQ